VSKNISPFAALSPLRFPDEAEPGIKCAEDVPEWVREFLEYFVEKFHLQLWRIQVVMSESFEDDDADGFQVVFANIGAGSVAWNAPLRLRAELRPGPVGYASLYHELLHLLQNDLFLVLARMKEAGGAARALGFVLYDFLEKYTEREARVITPLLVADFERRREGRLTEFGVPGPPPDGFAPGAQVLP
jgi:hypothetical protein